MTSVLWINLECRSTFVTLKLCSSVVLVVVAIQLSFSIAGVVHVAKDQKTFTISRIEFFYSDGSITESRRM
jgi:hypothetical protein